MEPVTESRGRKAAGEAAGSLATRRALSWAGHGLNDSYFFLLPLVLPVIIRGLDLQLRGAGLLVSAFLFAVAVSSYLAGRIADRLDSWKLIAGGFVLAAAGMAGASFARHLPLLLALLVLAGAGVGTFHPSVYAQFDRLAFARTGGSFGVFEFFGSATVVVMFFVNGTLLDRLGWQGVLRLIGVAGVLTALLYLWRYRRGAAGTRGGGRPAEGPRTESGAGPLLALFLVAVVLRSLSVNAVLNFMPTFLVLERGLPPNLAAYASAFIFAGGMVLCLFLGRAADRFGPVPTLLLITAFIAPLVLLLSLPLPLWTVPPLLALLGGFLSGAAPTQNLFLSRLQSRLGTGTTFGLLMGLIALMASLAPAVFGYLADRLGIALSMRLFSVPGALSLAALAVLARVGAARPRRAARSPWGGRG